MVCYSRRPRRPDRWLPLKIVALVATFALVFIGARFQQSWAIWTAIGTAVGGWALRFLRASRDTE